MTIIILLNNAKCLNLLNIAWNNKSFIIYFHLYGKTTCPFGLGTLNTIKGTLVLQFASLSSNY